MPLPLIGGGIKWCFCLTSVVYIGPKSRTERPRKTKIGREVAYITRDSDTTFKVKRSKIKVITTAFAPGSCSGDHRKVFTVGTYCYVAICRRDGRLCGTKRFGAHRWRSGAGAYRGGRPPTAWFIWNLCWNDFAMSSQSYHQHLSIWQLSTATASWYNSVTDTRCNKNAGSCVRQQPSWLL